MSLAAVAKRFEDEAAAWEYMEDLRWHGKPMCPHCGSENAFYLEPRTGEPRTTRKGTQSYRRVWKCKDCKRQFSCLVGTIFEGTKIPLSKWLMAIYLMCAGKNGVAALELERDLDITYKSAWHMVQRIRLAMANTKGNRLAGVIVADETFVGGNPAKMNNQRKPRRSLGPNSHDKKPVFTIVDKRTGEIRSQVVEDVQTRTLRPIVDANVDKLGSILYTDQGPQYTSIGRRFAKHHTVDHSASQWVDYETGATTNIAECYFGQLKRSIVGTHHGVAEEHLQRYVREFDFRWNTCRDADGERAMKLMDQTAGVKLSYSELIAEGPFALGKWERPPGRPGPRQAGPQPLRLMTED
jgi:transposase-like protein